MVISFIMGIMLASCSDDFLEVDVNGRLIAETTEDYSQLLSSPFLAGYFSPTRIALSPEVCMLEPFNSGVFFPTKLPAFRWQDDIYLPDDDINEISEFARSLYTYNKIINEVLNSKGGSESEKLSLQAEAYAGRAWTYFQLINYFGKPYDPATSSTDLGFPIITESDITQTNFEQGTVEDVYQFILDDLNKAIPNLPDTFNRLRMSLGAGKALLAKVHIFMGDYEQGLDNLNEAFIHFDAAPLEVGIYDYNITTLPGGVHALGFLGPGFVNANVNIENPYSRENTNFDGFFGAELLLAPETTMLYGATDIRRNHFFSNSANAFAPPFALPNILRLTSGPSAPYGINIPDLYLLRAECKLRLNNIDGAIEDLQFLRSHRMPVTDASLPAGLSKDELLIFTIEERTREFAVRGMEWFTTRRLFTDPLFSGKTHTRTIYNTDGTIKETFILTPERLVVRFNKRFINQNPNFTNNP